MLHEWQTPGGATRTRSSKKRNKEEIPALPNLGQGKIIHKNLISSNPIGFSWVLPIEAIHCGQRFFKNNSLLTPQSRTWYCRECWFKMYSKKGRKGTQFWLTGYVFHFILDYSYGAAKYVWSNLFRKQSLFPFYHLGMSDNGADTYLLCYFCSPYILHIEMWLSQ